MSARLSADDRALFYGTGTCTSPHVFVLFDTSGSMNQTPCGSGSGCPTPPLGGDDPASKLYQAKQALYEVLDEAQGLSFGFGTFPNHDRHLVYDVGCDGDCASFASLEDYCDPVESDSCAYCKGLEENDDTDLDYALPPPSNPFSPNVCNPLILWETETNTRGLEIGDLIPLDWGDDNRRRIQERLAPNLALDESTPDFSNARYVQEVSCPLGSSYYDLRDSRARPIGAAGLTPIANALDDFRLWYDAWLPAATSNAPADFLDKEIAVVLLTDGYETCDGDPVSVAQDLQTVDGIKTYVIGFDIQNPQLDSIAAAGGTEESYFAANKLELVEALRSVLLEIGGGARSFTTAAHSSTSMEFKDMTFLTSFFPVQDASYWPGHLDAFIKPVPLGEGENAGLPDRDRVCSDQVTDGCRIWDAGEALLSQAPTPSDVDVNDLHLGPGADQRRVLYCQGNAGDGVPRPCRSFSPPSDSSEELDLYGPDGMGLDPSSDSFAADGRAVIETTLVQKEVTVLDSDGPRDETFVLTDIFHSDPALVGSPSRYLYYVLDVGGKGGSCDDGDPGYACFFEKHRFRRRMLFAGSNGGQLHAFDAGLPSLDGGSVPTFDYGSGRELFAFVPRAVLPAVRRMAQGEGQELTVDGPLTVDDVLIDPFHERVLASASDTSPPQAGDREWRTVLVGGLREGGHAYYALDITQPDRLDEDGLGQPVNGYVPSCMDGGSDCGTLPFAAVLWEFTDTSDEDGNGFADLGQTWSKANTGRIRVVEEGETVDKYVAIFGGGMDPQGLGQTGNWLYMLDIETGKALYKRRLDLVGGVHHPSSAPAEPAAVDTNRDGYLDTVYIGTTAGFLFKVDLSVPQTVESVTIDGVEEHRVLSSAWEPFAIFDASDRPIYHPPAVIYSAEQEAYALAFATGERQDLFAQTGQEGRFYLVLDNHFAATTPDLPVDETSYQAIEAELEGNVGPTENYLVEPDLGKRAGWYLRLETEERAISRAAVVSGVVAFSTFLPDGMSSAQCGGTGKSRIYTVKATNGDGISDDQTLLASGRAIEVDDFVSNPFLEMGTTVQTDQSEPCQNREAVGSALSDLFPPTCKFGNMSMNLMAVRADTGVECIAPIPICVVEKNWREF